VKFQRANCRCRSPTSADALADIVADIDMIPREPVRQASLATRDLTVRFGGHVAVDGVTAEFYPGTLSVIVGPNGAGKTTYFNLISGQLAASSGSVFVQGRDVTRLGAARRTRLGVGRAFQLTSLFPHLSVMENVRLAVQSRAGIGLSMLSLWTGHTQVIERAEHYLERVALMPRRDALVGTLPHGDQRKLEVAILLALEPQVMMFDEPTAGMSVDEVPVVLDLIRRVKLDADKTVLLVEHKMDVVRSLADRILVLHNGALVADGPPLEVMQSKIVQEAYLGVTEAV
jgi:branched-chain amino acid transport system ATP-binding protein